MRSMKGYAEILSINTGMPQDMMYHEKVISSGINKQPTDKPLYLTNLNLEGDGQADLKHHGGKEKAVCVYPFEHYRYWEKQLQRSLVYGAFGENLTIQGLLESDVCIGDIFKLGEAVVQISQPRQPCFKLSAKYGLPEMPMMMQESGYTGFYFRVLEEGAVSRSKGLYRRFPHPKGITVAYANQIMHHDKHNMEAVQRILEVEELSVNWRATFLKRLTGSETSTKERLTGQA